MESAEVESPADAGDHPDIAKFTNGGPIDKLNPFKAMDATDYQISSVRTKKEDIVSAENDDEEDISTEDVRNQSKYVKTYIMKPDKYFTLDPAEIRRVQQEERAAQNFRPIPRSRVTKNNQAVAQPTKVWKRGLLGANKYAVYPDLADIKVRTGAADKDDDVEYYDSAEVKFNAEKFDDRFRAVKFSSQDDLDTIAEQTEAMDADGDSSKEREQIINNNLRAEPKNKSYTNTVSSKEFKEYLRAKGLALVKLGNRKTISEDMKQKQPIAMPRTSHIPRPAAVAEVTSSTDKKSSVMQRLLNRNRQLPVNSLNQKQATASSPPHSQMSRGRATAIPQIQSNYSNAYYHDVPQARQRHSTPIKSTSVSPQQSQPQRLSVKYRRPATIDVSNNIRRANFYNNGEHAMANRKVVSCAGGGSDNSSMLHMPSQNQQQFPISSSNTPVENIYESTDRLQKSRLSVLNGIVPNNNEPKQRSLSRNEIYAHLFAFYQKSKRNSTSSEMTLPGGRSQSRNSGDVIYSQPILQHVNSPRLSQYPPYYHRQANHLGDHTQLGNVTSTEDEEEWHKEKGGGGGRNAQQLDSDDRRRAAGPRRHMGMDMQYGIGPGGGMSTLPLQRSMDLEMGTRHQKSRKNVSMRGYATMGQNQGALFDDDPGIMSEVETSSTGFRRGNKQRSSLPVVRTPSKTLERPLGLVFLQFRSETKRALLPNEITSIDTVRALFVRSFPRQLTMAYLEGPASKIYIHDASKDMFYELEDVRSHLREIRDRSVLRLFESTEVAAPLALPGGPGIPQPLPQPVSNVWDQEQNYFSEPEFDTEYQHQHIHKNKLNAANKGLYYEGSLQSLPRGAGGYVERMKDGYMSSPERCARTGYEEPYYSQYGTRGAMNQMISEEHGDSLLNEDQYSLYSGTGGGGGGSVVGGSGKVPSRGLRAANQSTYESSRPEELHRMRVEHMERQLANLTGLVQKALINPRMAPIGSNQNFGNTVSDTGSNQGTLRSDKSVSFEKSVSFSDDILDGAPKSHNPQHPGNSTDTKPSKPAIKSSTLPRMSSQDRSMITGKSGGHVNSHNNYHPDLTLAPEMYNHLRGLQKKTKELRTEARALRRMSQAQAIAIREDINDAFMRIRATMLANTDSFRNQDDNDKRLSREEELYKQEVFRLEKDLGELESSVEGLRSEVINRRTRVNMASVEDMALILSRASKTVAELKIKFPSLQCNLRVALENEMDKVAQEEKFLKEEPDRLELALRRCKKLTGTLVTLKRLASVQEQRTSTDVTALQIETDPSSRQQPDSIQLANKPNASPRMGAVALGGGYSPENALDALLDELQTFAKPTIAEIRPDDSTSDDSSQTLRNTIQTNPINPSNLYPDSYGASYGGLKRLHSYPSGSDTDTSPPRPPMGKPPVPERNSELISKVANKRTPPAPPPRTSSRSPLASPTSPSLPSKIELLSEQAAHINAQIQQQQKMDPSQDGVQRQMALELRHQELLKKQKVLQDQYSRLQEMSKTSGIIQGLDQDQGPDDGKQSSDADGHFLLNRNNSTASNNSITNKIYETEIL